MTVAEGVRVGPFPRDNPAPNAACVKTPNGRFVAVPTAAVWTDPPVAMVTAEDLAAAEAVSNMDAGPVDSSFQAALQRAVPEGVCAQFLPARDAVTTAEVYLELPGHRGSFVRMDTMALLVTDCLVIPIVTPSMLRCLENGG